MSEPVYLDHNATTPVDPRVAEAMVDALRTNFGNAASRHEFGARAERSVDGARNAVANLINGRPEDVLFTSGATESNNLVLWGAAARRNDRTTVVTSEIEHPSVLEVTEALAKQGVVVRRVPPHASGLVQAEDVNEMVDDQVFLVSVMLANNEIGTINPVSAYAFRAHAAEALLHADATQAVGHIPVDVRALDVDLLSFSAHKLYGPKGVGALYVRRKARQRLSPWMLGGGHERGFRSGTLNVPAIIGFGVAADIARREMADTESRVASLRDLLLELLRDTVEDVIVNGSLDNRLAGNLSVSLPGVDAEALLVRLKDIVACSTGAACSSSKVEPSHVLMALSRDDDRAFSSVRFGIGRGNTEAEIRLVANAVAREARQLRMMSGRHGSGRVGSEAS